MANVKTHLNKILSAIYGKEVRSAIHDSIDAINTQVETTTSAENTRVTAEKNRATAESERAKAEIERAKAENTRVSQENTRKSEETKRAEAEITRVNAETERVKAESARVEAEKARAATLSAMQKEFKDHGTKGFGTIQAVSLTAKWKAPQDGFFLILISNLTQRSGRCSLTEIEGESATNTTELWTDYAGDRPEHNACIPVQSGKHYQLTLPKELNAIVRFYPL